MDTNAQANPALASYAPGAYSIGQVMQHRSR
jgi:hypothetical protein